MNKKGFSVALCASISIVSFFLLLPALTMLPQYLKGDQRLCVGSKHGISDCYDRESATPFMITVLCVAPIALVIAVRTIKKLDK